MGSLSLFLSLSLFRDNASFVPQLRVPGAERILLLRMELQRPRSGLPDPSRAQFHRDLHDRRCPVGHRSRQIQQVRIR